MILIAASSCRKKKEAKESAPEVAGNYFSINQFILDEWNTFSGEPFMITKTVKVGEKTDSVLTNSDNMEWGALMKTFSETDISDRKYLSQYKFTQFDDNADQSHNFFYEALDEDLFTRKLLIVIDMFSSRVKGIYIETEKKDIFNDRVCRLYYAPLKKVQIQTDEKALFGNKTHTVETYDFLR